ncbi:hypothetical protein [Roseospira goensis]|uniref:Uncharacterized protein n=1 Tax=Roseospira goensis TaxID=391922 RepID=A0A7W6RZ25_9PROT|nr:hypothetical protein [Roseospira goensis]MBB4285888.1 hypothetical protein [Roseospira goensis]
MAQPLIPGALLMPSGALLLRRRDGLLMLAPWDGRLGDGRLRAGWVSAQGVTEDDIPRPFTQRVVLFDRRGVWLWPGPLLENDPAATGRADYAAVFGAIPVVERLRMAERALDLAPLMDEA